MGAGESVPNSFCWFGGSHLVVQGGIIVPKQCLVGVPGSIFIPSDVGDQAAPGIDPGPLACKA